METLNPSTSTSTPSSEPPPDGHRPLSSLARELIGEVEALVTAEVTLAKTEVAEKVGQVERAIASSAIGAGLLGAGFLTLIGAAVSALALVWPVWASALVIGAAICAIGFILVAAARSRVRPRALVPERTVESLRSDKNLVRAHGGMAAEGAR